MQIAILIRIHASYTRSKKRRMSRANALYRKLYGYDTYSNYSRYNRHLKGVIEEIPSVRYDRGMVMVREVDLEKIVGLVEEYGAEYQAWKVIPNDEEMKQLQLQST